MRSICFLYCLILSICFYHPVLAVEPPSTMKVGPATIDFPEFPAHKEGRTRFFHTSLRVSNLEQSIAFYKEVLDFKLIRTHDMGLQRMAFMTTGDAEPILELVENKNAKKEELGHNFGHLGVFVDNLPDFYEKSKAKGDKWAMRPMRFDPAAPMFGFVLDPDGYRIEVMENPRPSDCSSCHRNPHLK